MISCKLLHLLRFSVHLPLLLVLANCLLASSCTPELRLPDTSNNTITVVQGDIIHQVQVLPREERVQVEPVRFYYYFSGGQLGKAEGAYLGKVLHGPYQQHTRKKQLLEQGVFNKGLKVGVWRQWHPDGYLSALETYEKGLADGSWIGYAPNGALAWRKHYKEGLPHGRWTTYYENSRPKASEHWKEGVRHGDFEEYYPSGKLKRSGSYHKGELHGVVREYSETGVVFKDRYRHGELKQKKEKQPEAEDGSKEKRKGLRKLFRLRKKKEEQVESQIMSGVPQQQPEKVEERKGLRKLFRLGSKKVEEAPRVENTMQQPEAEEAKKKPLRWWPFKKREKSAETTSKP